MGNVLQAGEGQAPARQAALGRAPRHRPVPDPQQGVRLRPQGRHRRRPGDRARRRRGGGGRRHGVDVATCPTTLAQHAQRRAHGQRRARSTRMIHDGLWDPYEQHAHGHVRRGLRRPSSEIIRATRRTSSRSSPPAAPSRAQKAGPLQGGDRPACEVRGKKGEPPWSPRTRARSSPGRRRSRRSSRSSRRTAPSPPPTPRPSTTAPPRWCSMSAERAKSEGRTVLGRLTGCGGAARKPVEFTIAPADAIKKRAREGRSSQPKDIDLWEINEAFAVVAHRQQPAARPRPAQGQRPRRRGGARSPHRRLGRAHPGHAAPRDEGPRQEARRSPRSASAAARRSR